MPGTCGSGNIVALATEYWDDVAALEKIVETGRQSAGEWSYC